MAQSIKARDRTEISKMFDPLHAPVLPSNILLCPIPSTSSKFNGAQQCYYYCSIWQLLQGICLLGRCGSQLPNNHDPNSPPIQLSAGDSLLTHKSKQTGKALITGIWLYLVNYISNNTIPFVDILSISRETQTASVVIGSAGHGMLLFRQVMGIFICDW